MQIPHSLPKRAQLSGVEVRPGTRYLPRWVCGRRSEPDFPKLCLRTCLHTKLGPLWHRMFTFMLPPVSHACSLGITSHET